MESKPFWKSKTLWINAALAAGAAFLDPLTKAIGPEGVGAIFAGVNAVLRLMTNRGVRII